MASSDATYVRTLEAFSPELPVNSLQIGYLRLALRLLEERSVLDRVLEEVERRHTKLSLNDLLWLSLRPDIETLGYDLATGDPGSQFPDRPLSEWRIMRAIRRCDGARVMLKIAWIEGQEDTRELDAYELLLSHPHILDPRNPILRGTCVLPVCASPLDRTSVTVKLLAMPLLHDLHTFYVPVWGCALLCIRQLLHGLAFLHSLGICHGDVHISNVILTGHVPYKVYFIDFDLCQQLEGDTRKAQWNGGKTVPPEVKNNREQASSTYDPYAADVYCMGMLWLGFQVIIPIAAMDDLRDAMTEDDPAQRPTAEEVAAAFDSIFNSMPRYMRYTPNSHISTSWQVHRTLAGFMWEMWTYMRDVMLALWKGMEVGRP